MQQRRKNNLGIFGWLGGGRYGADRYAYALHRLTGLGILAYFLMHIFVTGRRLGGPEKWDATMQFFKNPIFAIGEFVVFLAFIYHAINGIRLVLVELGFLVGKPGLPAYPYNYSTLRQRPALVCAMVLVAILVAVAGVDFLKLMH
jgi:succinate dehydrogenase / fumarate reductase, cytochrome b subunit